MLLLGNLRPPDVTRPAGPGQAPLGGRITRVLPSFSSAYYPLNPRLRLWCPSCSESSGTWSTGMIRPSVLDSGEARWLNTPRQPHCPRHLASKARRVFFSCVLLRRRCRNLCQTNGAATSTCSVRSRFITRPVISASLMPASSHPLDIIYAASSLPYERGSDTR
jgi:hypothetical protein